MAGGLTDDVAQMDRKARASILQRSKSPTCEAMKQVSGGESRLFNAGNDDNDGGWRQRGRQLERQRQVQVLATADDVTGECAGDMG